MKRKVTIFSVGFILVFSLSCHRAVISTGFYGDRVSGGVSVSADSDAAPLVALSLVGAMVGSAIYADSHQYVQQGLSAIDVNILPKNAEIMLDGVVVGTADQYDGFPAFLVVNPGTHTVKASLHGYKTYSVEVRLAPGQQVNLNKHLDPGVSEEIRPEASRPTHVENSQPASTNPVRVTFDISNADASIYVDDVFVGTAREVNQLHGPLLVDRKAVRISVVTPDQKRVFLMKDLLAQSQGSVVLIKVDF